MDQRNPRSRHKGPWMEAAQAVAENDEMPDSLATSIAVLANEMEHVNANLENIQTDIKALNTRLDTQDQVIQRGRGMLIILGSAGTFLFALPNLIAAYFRVKG